MKIVICGDTHIGAVFGLGGPNGKGGNTRVDDYEKTLNHIIDYAIERGVDAFIQTGDAFDSRNPTPEHLAVFNRAIRRLSMANILTVIIMGNHDYRRSGDIFTSSISSLAAQDYPNVRIVLEPQIMKLCDREEQGVNVLLLPYRDRRMYDGKTIEEDSRLYEQEVMDLIHSCNETIPIIAIGHNFYYNGSYNDFGGHEILVRVETFKKCDMVTMGHLHQFKIIKNNNPIAIYSGSMEKLNFGDEEIDKYFIDYDTSTKQTTIIKSPTRSLADLKLDLSKCTHSDLIETLNFRISEFQIKNKVVRLKILVKDNLVSFVKKNLVEEQLYAAGAFFVSKIITEPVFNRIIRDEAILNKKDDLSMFKAFIADQNLDLEIMNQILIEAQAIII